MIITSQTHSAIDNIGVKLAERGVHFLRLGNEKRIQPELFRFSEAKQIQDLTTLNDLEIFYNKMVSVSLRYAIDPQQVNVYAISSQNVFESGGGAVDDTGGKSIHFESYCYS